MSKRRWRQYQNQSGEWELIEIGPPDPPGPRVHLQTARPSYRSPIDGTAIEGRRAEREHMRRHDVVRPGDFGEKDGKDYYERARKERESYFKGESWQAKKEIKKDIVQSLEQLKQGRPAAKPQLEGDI